MKAVDVGRKLFDLISTTGSGTHNVVHVSFVQGWFRSCVLSENLLSKQCTELIREGDIFYFFNISIFVTKITISSSKKTS